MFKRIKAQTKNKNKTVIREKGRKVRGTLIFILNALTDNIIIIDQVIG